MIHEEYIDFESTDMWSTNLIEINNTIDDKKEKFIIISIDYFCDVFCDGMKKWLHMNTFW